MRAEWSLSPQSFQQLKNTPHSGDRPLRSPGKRQVAGLRMPIPVPLSHSGGCPSHELEQVEEDLSLPPSRPDPSLPPKLQDFGDSTPVIVPVLPSAPWGPEFRLVRTPLDVDLDIGQWVQGECRKLKRKRHISFALSVSQGPLLPEIQSTRCTSPFERPPRIHQGPVQSLLERFPAMVNL